MSLSILICTLDRPNELERCLDALVPQLGPQDQVVVLDNSLTGSARGTSAKYRVEYAQEPRRGLCVARNSARKVASGSVLAFLDDDAIPKAGWVEELHRFFDADIADGVGGPVHQVMPHGTDPRVTEFYAALEDSLHCGPYPRLYDRHESPLGGNCAVTAAAFDAVQGFDERISLYFDEVDFFNRVRDAGFSLAYEPSLIIDHSPPVVSLGRRAFMRRGYKHGRGIAQTANRDVAAGARHLCRAMGLGMLGVCSRRWDRLFSSSAELGRARELIFKWR